jgi:hypothetical protein
MPKGSLPLVKTKKPADNFGGLFSTIRKACTKGNLICAVTSVPLVGAEVRFVPVTVRNGTKCVVPLADVNNETTVRWRSPNPGKTIS